MATPHSVRPGDLLGGKYRLRARLAAGGMGEIWAARNETTGAEVAVKLCSAEGTERLLQEARAGAMLSHRSAVRVFDLIDGTDGRRFLVMELLRGETLAEWVRARGALGTREALAIVLPVLSALDHAHALGIVHRDVTPANIFLAVDPDGRVIPKIVDFGVAKLPSPDVRTIDGRALGTPRYMSPEQIRGQEPLDGRSDVFSAAVVLYEAMTGECPFAASSPAASLASVLETVVDPDPRIDPRVWVEIQRALAKRPYERHRSAGELAAALLAASGATQAELDEHLQRPSPPHAHEPDSVPGVSPPPAGTEPPPPKKMASSSRWIPILAASAGLVVASVLALSWRPHENATRAATERAEPLPPTDPSMTARSAPPVTPASQATQRDQGLPALPVAADPRNASPSSSAQPAATAHPSSTPRAPATPPPRPAHRRPVATTPGF
jgi:serine/threonine-protein kinase